MTSHREVLGALHAMQTEQHQLKAIVKQAVGPVVSVSGAAAGEPAAGFMRA